MSRPGLQRSAVQQRQEAEAGDKAAHKPSLPPGRASFPSQGQAAVEMCDVDSVDAACLCVSSSLVVRGYSARY